MGIRAIHGIRTPRRECYFGRTAILALSLPDNNLAENIGEIPGNMPASYGDILTFQTPNAKLFFTISFKYFDRIDGTKACLPLIPHYEVEAAYAIDKLYKIITCRTKYYQDDARLVLGVCYEQVMFEGKSDMLRAVEVENGTVRGLPAADPRITSFKDIPFAAPPVGMNRWRAPQPVEDWDGALEALGFAPISMQVTSGLDKDNARRGPRGLSNGTD